MLLDPTLRLRRLLRVALSHYVLNGLSVALGLLVISAGVHWWLGAFAASAAAVGVIVSGPPDVPAPRRGMSGWKRRLIEVPFFRCGNGKGL